MSTKSKEISLDEIRHLAALAKLRFSDDELAAMKHDLARIVAYVEKLAEVDVEGVPATTHVLDLTNVFRDDKAGDWLTQEEALANAPAKKHGYFSVPKVIG